MFSNIKASAKTTSTAANYGQDEIVINAVCLSTDTKPTQFVANGSLVLEMDTNKIYAFDAEGEAWIELG